MAEDRVTKGYRVDIEKVERQLEKVMLDICQAMIRNLEETEMRYNIGDRVKMYLDVYLGDFTINIGDEGEVVEICEDAYLVKFSDIREAWIFEYEVE